MDFLRLVYGTLSGAGIDTKGMSTSEAVEKYKELQKKGDANEKTDARKISEIKLQGKGYPAELLRSKSDAELFGMLDKFEKMGYNNVKIEIDIKMKSPQWRQFYQELNKLKTGGSLIRLQNGDIAVPIANRLVVQDGIYENPHAKFAMVFKTEDEATRFAIKLEGMYGRQTCN